MASFTLSIAGDSAVNLEFARSISPETSSLVRSAAQALADDPIPGVVELVPTFCSLMVCYNPLVIGYDDLAARLSGTLRAIPAAPSGMKRVVSIPVCYGGEFGPDLPAVCQHAGMSASEVIAAHSAPDYLIDMLGFLPGFAYLGGLDPRLHTPRLSTPRTSIPAGSVGIGGAQTGVYPLASPGGWQLIGRTPVRPYDPAREQPILYAAGDYLRFVPITDDQYHAISARVQAGDYRCRIDLEDR
ncbi:5-oxoprolinase subunit PxpB [Eggerthellaceae bacterium zg-1084]|uniref:5-oxoprolinase subunit PxpB n=1 Tax=Berryella wangjianweii TaxID=2734634 RepID=A0A6M8J8W4_9ACTN|nr:5-oxoprolinase subunit PxpB [Berryella wangjianweii]NPD31546.1 5-oxoprolinase subunit PxpB [Berryella wangjianweii]NPD32959.1 5-oxoprolinase subunit PxpB [Eggerthellaceae bacterium zg-997]QKF07829.1 5-oxoprolinase subunit PxpB [Berryella wangjianweii]